jgi:16S rRNA (uracil1498-N3)-methyltransferase
VEKAVELGVHRIVLLKTERVAFIKVKVERLQKLALAALKQSQRSWLPPIDGPIDFQSFIKANKDPQRYLAWLEEENPQLLQQLAKPTGPITILIGPEGDFTPQEVELARGLGWQPVSLGAARLRTETAGMYVCASLAILAGQLPKQ